jgi:precorrin-6A/cobalt-precorrin-6A reductase
MRNKMRLLILGGTTEARLLAEQVAGHDGFEAELSLAGRTAAPLPQALACRVGGFGGVAGLTEYLRSGEIEVLVDATHPFAERISENAVQAARSVGIPLLTLTRAPWTAQPGDRWTEIPDAAAAAQAIGKQRRRVFLTVGRQQVAAFEAAPQHDYLIRTIDPPEPMPALPSARILLARGPFSLETERELMARQGIEVLVSKNSGGAGTRAKIDAARELGLPVILIRRPAEAGGLVFHEPGSLMEELGRLRHAASPAERGV